MFINEVDADTPGNGFDVAEFVELYDGGVGNTPLDGLTVVFYNGSPTRRTPRSISTATRPNASGYFTLGNPGVAGVDITFEPGDFGFLQNGADAVAFVAGNAVRLPEWHALSTANLIDAVVYDTDDADDPELLALLNAGQPQVNENAGGDGPNQSSGRCAERQRRFAQHVDLSRRARRARTARTTASAAPSNSPIVISQFYGSGGNAGAHLSERLR